MIQRYQDYISKYHYSYELCYGKCHEAVRQMQKEFPELRTAVGYVFAGSWGDREHAWLVDVDGNIVDPTAKQFPGVGDYREWQAGDPVDVGPCANCGEAIWVKVQRLEDATRKILCGEACEKAYAAYIMGECRR